MSANLQQVSAAKPGTFLPEVEYLGWQKNSFVQTERLQWFARSF
jgi:hypothetical protein